MERRSYTLLIFSGAHGRTRKILLPYYLAYVVAAFSALGLLTAAVLIHSYVRMLLKVSDYNAVRTEREVLKTQYRKLEDAVSQVNVKLDSLRSLASEVALTYGFGGARRIRFPETGVALTSINDPALGPTSATSLYAFNLLTNAITLGSFPSLSFETATLPSIWPVRGAVTAGFGQRMDPFSGEGAFHAGLDISAPQGTAVNATGEGLIFHAGPDHGYGNEILIDHGYGIKTKYGHLSTIYVVVGQEVKRGQLIGAVGNTGKATGPHLHYEVLVHETPVNPSRFLQG